jgi:hypothetical protein
MKKETFQIQFNYEGIQRQLKITSDRPAGPDPVAAMYEVFWREKYLFTLYPTFDDDSLKTWKLLEKEGESHLPLGFLNALGHMIEEVYILN